MDKTLQIVELMLNVMEKNPGRYKVEVTTHGICIIDFIEIIKMKSKMPTYYTFFHKPTESYQSACNSSFDEFIGGLKA